MSEINQKTAYKKGRQDRLDRKGIGLCPYGDKINKALWRSGWHDTDMHIAKRELKEVLSD